MKKAELFNDHFQNFKVYGIPKAQFDITGHIPSFHSPKTHLPCQRDCAGMESELKSASNSVWISLPNGRKN